MMKRLTTPVQRITAFTIARRGILSTHPLHPVSPKLQDIIGDKESNYRLALDKASAYAKSHCKIDGMTKKYIADPKLKSLVKADQFSHKELTHAIVDNIFQPKTVVEWSPPELAKIVGKADTPKAAISALWEYAQRHCTIDPKNKNKTVYDSNDVMKAITGKDTFQYKDIREACAKGFTATKVYTHKK